MRILFCNIAWMDYYKGIVEGKDEPQNGGSYVNITGDAHEKYNFAAVLLYGVWSINFKRKRTNKWQI